MRIDRGLLGWGVFLAMAGGLALAIQEAAIADRAWWSFWLLILVGGFFLAREVVPGMDLGRLWPVGSLILGIVFIAASIRPGRSAA